MIFERVQELLADQLEVDPEKITMETDIVEDLAADSLDIAELIMILEEEYNLLLADAPMQDVKTVGDIVEIVEKLAK